MEKAVSYDVFSHTFPVIKGIQAGREYFVAMVPMKMIPSLFTFNDPDLPPDLRAQRLLNKSRVPLITRYIIDNSENYVFSSLTASIDRIIEFHPIPPEKKDSKIGYINIPADTRIVINDGQHRRAAIIEALKKKPELGYETISVVFFIDTGLKRSQQMFADLNRYAVKPSGSLNILYDYRDDFSRFVLDLINEVPIFKDNIDYEKTSISNRSRKLFTLSSIYRATKTFVGTYNDDAYRKHIAADFWNEVTSSMKPWEEFLHGKPPYRLRQDTIAVHSLTLQVIAVLGSTIIDQYPNVWREKLSLIKDIDWSRSNPDWEGRALMAGRLRKSYSNVVLTGNYLKLKLGLPLTEKELEYEKRLGG